MCLKYLKTRLISNLRNNLFYFSHACVYAFMYQCKYGTLTAKVIYKKLKNLIRVKGKRKNNS